MSITRRAAALARTRGFFPLASFAFPLPFLGSRGPGKAFVKESASVLPLAKQRRIHYAAPAISSGFNCVFAGRPLPPRARNLRRQLKNPTSSLTNTATRMTVPRKPETERRASIRADVSPRYATSHDRPSWTPRANSASGVPTSRIASPNASTTRDPSANPWTTRINDLRAPTREVAVLLSMPLTIARTAPLTDSPNSKDSGHP